MSHKMDSTFAPQLTTTTNNNPISTTTVNTGMPMPLTTSPAQTCIALGARYHYGRQGLPDLPTRLSSQQQKNIKNNNNSTTTVTATLVKRATTPGAVSGPDSTQRKTTTVTTLNTVSSARTSAPQRKDYYDGQPKIPFSGSHHPYQSELEHTTSSIKRHNITVCENSRHRSGNTSTASSSSSTHVNTGRSVNRRRSSSSRATKKLIVIKQKKSKRHSKASQQDNEKESTTMQDTSSSSIPLISDEAGDFDFQAKSGMSSVSKSPVLELDDNETSAKDGGLDKPVDHFDYDCMDDNNDDNDDVEVNYGEDGAPTTAHGEQKQDYRSAAIEKVRCVGLPLLKQRLGYLWENKKFTDVIFLIGHNRQKIEAHRVILASCSEIFQGLLYSTNKEGTRPLQNSEGKYILYENDFSVSALEVFIKAMYTNEIPICLTLALALEVFYATKKYAVMFLEDQVLQHIKELLSVSNVFEALRFSTSAVELTYLAPICWRIVEERTGEVLEYHLEVLEAYWLGRVLERDRLSLEEEELFQFAVRWAANQCKINGLKTTGKNKRRFVEPLLKHFRFTTLPPALFHEVVVPSRILEQREVQQIQMAFNKVADLNNIALPYKTTPRVNPATTVEYVTPLGRLTSQKHLYPRTMDGSGDYGVNPHHQHLVQQVTTINSDPGLSAKGTVNSGANKKGTSSSTRLRVKRVSSSSQNKAR